MLPFSGEQKLQQRHGHLPSCTLALPCGESTEGSSRACWPKAAAGERDAGANVQGKFPE